MSKHRRAAHRMGGTAPADPPARIGRHAGTDVGGDGDVMAGTSIGEIAVYGMLASVVAGGVFILGGHPRWYAVAVVVGALLLVTALGLASSRAPRASSAAPRSDQSPISPSTSSRRGRRRRR